VEHEEQDEEGRVFKLPTIPDRMHIEMHILKARNMLLGFQLKQQPPIVKSTNFSIVTIMTYLHDVWRRRRGRAKKKR
jgi:hypothetical protein